MHYVKYFGEVRYTTPSKTLPTRYTFTGQYSYVNDDATDLGNAGFGLMFYNARFYDPQVGRFTSADTVVPGGVQGQPAGNFHSKIMAAIEAAWHLPRQDVFHVPVSRRKYPGED